MRKYVLMGIIALVMLLAVPAAMADTTAPVSLAGSVVSSYSISAVNDGSGDQTISGPWLSVGDNQWNWGHLIIVAKNTGWSVSATTDGFSGKESQMWASPSDNTKVLQSTIQQLTPSSAAWVNVKEYTDSGVIGDTGHTNPLWYKQPVLGNDAAGSYQLTVTYAITAV